METDGPNPAPRVYGQQYRIFEGGSTGGLVAGFTVAITGGSVIAFAAVGVNRYFSASDTPVVLVVYGGLASLLLASGALLTRMKTWAWWLAFGASVSATALLATYAGDGLECLSRGSILCTPGWASLASIVAITLAMVSLVALAVVYGRFPKRKKPS